MYTCVPTCSILTFENEVALPLVCFNPCPSPSRYSSWGGNQLSTS
jgi:hypothetical protein